MNTLDPADRPGVYTPDEAAVILKVSADWLKRRAAARKIPFTMLGGCYCFSNEHLNEIVHLYEQLPGQVAREEPARPRRRRRASSQQTDDEAPVTRLRPRPRPDGPRRKTTAA